MAATPNEAHSSELPGDLQETPHAEDEPVLAFLAPHANGLVPFNSDIPDNSGVVHDFLRKPPPSPPPPGRRRRYVKATMLRAHVTPSALNDRPAQSLLTVSSPAPALTKPSVPRMANQELERYLAQVEEPMRTIKWIQGAFKKEAGAEVDAFEIWGMYHNAFANRTTEMCPFHRFTELLSVFDVVTWSDETCPGTQIPRKYGGLKARKRYLRIEELPGTE